MPKPKKTEAPKLLRVHQAADRLNVSPSTIYLWCDHGHLVKVLLSGRVMRVTEQSVDLLIENGFIRGLN